MIFVKTYKTASTTVAMILNSIAFKLRLKCLHPLDKGWFQEGELKARVAQGQSFEVSFRHMSPVLELDVLQEVRSRLVEKEEERSDYGIGERQARPVLTYANAATTTTKLHRYF